MRMERSRAWVSESRFLPYLEESSGNEPAAWELYEWNAKVSSALSEVIHHVEVLLRNSMIQELSKLHPLAYPWHTDNKTVSAVASKLSRKLGDATATENDVISHLNLGFWKKFLQDKPVANEELWRTCLKDAFPHAIVDRKTVLYAVEDLFEIQTRCAHHDSLLRFDPHVELKKILKLARWIDPNAGSWLAEIESVSVVAKTRPVAPNLDTAVLGDSDDRTFRVYERTGAVINQTGRKIGPVKYLGFYHDRRIQPCFPRIERIEVPTIWNLREAQRLKSSENQEEKALGKIMQFGLNNGFPAGGNYEVYVVTGKNSEDTLRTTSGEPIHHHKKGRGSGFVKGGLRYFPISSLIHSTDTSELA